MAPLSPRAVNLVNRNPGGDTPKIIFCPAIWLPLIHDIIQPVIQPFLVSLTLLQKGSNSYEYLG